MANRDTINFREVTQQVVENKNGLMLAGAELAADIVRQGQEAKITENFSKAQLDLNALQTQYQIDFEGDPMGGMDGYKQKRQEIFDTYAEQISPLFRRTWNDNTRKLAYTNDATQQGWALKQTRINTVKAVNAAMKNSFKQANTDGQNFGNSDETEIGAYVNYEGSKQNLEGFASKNLGETTSSKMLSGYSKDYMKSFIAGVAETNPKKAAGLLESEAFKDRFDTDELETFENVIRKSMKRQKLGSLFQEIDNEDKATEIVTNPEGDYFSKRLEIDQMEFSGQISTEAATKARRVLTSQKSLDSLTNSDDMADIVNQMYDLNAMADTNSEDYLVGVQNVRNQILDMQAKGKLNATDASKLNSQLRTLTSQKTSQATQSVGMGFYDSNQKFNVLPPQYRGKATRELFYRTHGQDLSDEQMNVEANKVIDEINGSIRNETVRKLKQVSTPDADFLKAKGYSLEDVKETAKKYGLTEEQVIQKLKAK